MSVASMICAYLQKHGEATRPELQRELDLHEKAVGSAMRKLLDKGFVRDTGEMRRSAGKRSAHVYALGAKSFSQEAFSTGSVPRGRPSMRPADRNARLAFDALSRAMSAFFNREAA